MSGPEASPRMPILVDVQGWPPKWPRSWPMEPFQAAREQCLANHCQDPETLAARGGLSPGEALAVLTGRRWRETVMVPPREAMQKIAALVGEALP